jgi:radical SAM superfamily enzyme YgiQ (UPF0313 family)
VKTPSVTIGLVQLNSGADTFLPYTPGLLQAALGGLSPTPTRYRFLLPLWQYRQPLAAAVAHLQTADVVGFSLYVWNFERSLAIARALKALRPDVLTLVGGPQVPDQAEAFLRAHPEIDLCVHGEAELRFVELLEAWPERPWAQMPGLSWLDDSGGFQVTAPAPRQNTLAMLPSPWLSGVYEPLLAAYPEVRWAALWETNRGCPFTCSYCDWGSATGSKIHAFPLERLQAELAWFAAHRIEFIFCCDANFGILPRDPELAAAMAALRRTTGYPKLLGTQNTKNVTERAWRVYQILIEAGLNHEVTLSVQSLAPAALKAIRRENISLAHYREIQARAQAGGIRAYTDVILGLPGETFDSFRDGVSALMAAGQTHALRFFNASLLPNAEMNQPVYRERYQIESVRIPMVYLHSSAAEPEDGLYEYQEIVIATASLTRAQWAASLAFAWMTDLLFYGRHLLRPALLFLHQQTGLSYRALLECFLDAPVQFPLLYELQSFFRAKADAIQRGDFEYCREPAALCQGIWRSADEVMALHLITPERLPSFLGEVAGYLQQRLAPLSLSSDQIPDLIPDLMRLCYLNLLLAQQVEPIEVHFSSNVVEVAQARLQGQELPLQPEAAVWVKDWPGEPFRVRRL